MARKTRHCRPCPKIGHRRRCAHRNPKTGKCKGSPRFTDACKTRFRKCMKSELQQTGSMKSAGKVCMTDLQRCAGSRTQRAAVRKYKRARA